MNKGKELLEILERGGVYSTTELAKELDVNKIEVSRLVRNVRKRFLNGKIKDYIYTDKNGYSLDGTKTQVVYEGNLRIKMGIGVLLNGTHVLQRCKRISNNQFRNLRVIYKPKMITLANLLK